MAYQIQCRTCERDTWASNIVELIERHTVPPGRFRCSGCGGVDTYIFRSSKLLEDGEVWERWIKGIIRIPTEFETYSPYVFLTAQSGEDQIDGIHFNYYKDTRSQGGALKHGHGPGGAPVLTQQELFFLLKGLVQFGAVTVSDLRQLVEQVQRETTAAS